MLGKLLGGECRISDAELLKLVMDRYPEQPTPFIIEQFTVLKAGLIQANNKLAAMDMEEHVCEQVIIEEPMPEAAEAAPSAAPKKKFTKISMKQNWTTWRNSEPITWPCNLLNAVKAWPWEPLPRENK